MLFEEKIRGLINWTETRKDPNYKAHAQGLKHALAIFKEIMDSSRIENADPLQKWELLEGVLWIDEYIPEGSIVHAELEEESGYVRLIPLAKEIEYDEFNTAIEEDEEPEVYASMKEFLLIAKEYNEPKI